MATFNAAAHGDDQTFAVHGLLAGLEVIRDGSTSRRRLFLAPTMPPTGTNYS
jgi:hypothetical protein